MHNRSNSRAMYTIVTENVEITLNAQQVQDHKHLDVHTALQCSLISAWSRLTLMHSLHDSGNVPSSRFSARDMPVNCNGSGLFCMKI